MRAAGFQPSEDLPRTLYDHTTGSWQCRLMRLKEEHVLSFETAVVWVRKVSVRKCL